MSFEHQVTVGFSQVDAAGVLFFSRAFEIFHTSFEQLLRAGGSGLEQILEHREWILPLVHAEADYRRPLRLGDRVSVDVTVSASTGSSLTFSYALTHVETGALHVTGQMVHAAVDPASFKSIRVPAAFLSVLREAGLDLPEA